MLHNRLFALPTVSQYGAKGVAWAVVAAELLVMLYAVREIRPILRVPAPTR